MNDNSATFQFQGAPRLMELPQLPVRVARASLDLSEWLQQQRQHRLPEWVVCNRADDDHGRDTYSAEPEWGRPCQLCGTSCYVKGDFVEQGFRVTDWWCFRNAGGREVMFHPDMWAEIEAAGYATMAWETIGEMRAWLAEPDVRGAHTAALPPRWRWLTRLELLGNA